MKKTGTLTKSMLAVALGLLLFVSAAVFLLPVASGRVSAETKTSDLWKTSDGVKNEGTADGSKLTLTGTKTRTKGEVSFKNTLYMGSPAQAEEGNKAFVMKLTIDSDSFTRLTLSFLSEHHNTTITEELVNTVEFSKLEGGKLGVNFKNGETEKYDSETTEALADRAFSGTEEITVTYREAADATGKFTVAVGSVTRESLPRHGIVDNEATLRIGFDEVTTDAAAQITVREINGQSLAAPSNTAIEDTQDPLVVLHTDKMSGTITEGGVSYYLVGSRSDNDIAYSVYDVLQTKVTTKLKVTKAGTDGSYNDETAVETEDSTHLTIREAGSYKAVYSVQDKTAGDTYIDAPAIYFRAVEDTVAPYIDLTNYETTNNDYFTKYAPAGKEYRLPAPKINDDYVLDNGLKPTSTSNPNKGIDNAETVKWYIWYKTPTSSDWTKSEGLKFTPASEGRYLVKFQCKDRSGNLSRVTDEAIEIEFRDVDPPTLTISNFPEFGYPTEELSIPSGSVSDTVDSSPTKTLKVYWVEDENGNALASADKDGNPVEGNPGREIELKNNRFKPSADMKGKYAAVYTVTDAARNTVTETKYFTVKDDDRPKPPPTWDFWTPWSITFVCIGSAALLGLVIVAFIPKKKENQ